MPIDTRIIPARDKKADTLPNTYLQQNPSAICMRFYGSQEELSTLHDYLFSDSQRKNSGFTVKCYTSAFNESYVIDEIEVIADSYFCISSTLRKAQENNEKITFNPPLQLLKEEANNASFINHIQL